MEGPMALSPATEAAEPVARAADTGSEPVARFRPGPPSYAIRRRFHRGHAKPRGVVWFGVRSFWGHLRHFIASAIATEDIDSRDWMTPDHPQTLLARASQVLAGAPDAECLVDAIGRDLWIDFVADTG